MINTVILDWSGVVSDDWALTFAATNDILQELGLKRLSEKKFRELYELPWIRFYEKLGAVVDVEKEYKRWARIYPKHLDKEKLFPFGGKAIEWLKSRGKKAIVFSAKTQEHLEQEIKEYGLESLIDFSYGSNEDKGKKIHLLVARHEIEKKSAIYVGDMVHDIETARQAGIRSVAVLSGYDSREKLENAKPDFIIKDLGELPALIERLEAKEK